MVYGNTNKALEYIIFEEGVIRKLSTGYSWEYNLKDHLGNTRTVFIAGATAPSSVKQTSDYYPFGQTFAPMLVNNSPANKYLYNGKELQDDKLDGSSLNMLDYGARFYDAQIGRWGAIDPSSETYYSWTTYNYCGNNPMNLIDIDGMDWYQWKDDKGNMSVVWREGDAKSVEIDGYSYSNVGTSFSLNIGNNVTITFNQKEADSMTETVLNESDFKSQMTGRDLPGGKYEKKSGEEGNCFYQSGEMVKSSGTVSGVNDGKDGERDQTYIDSEIDNGHSSRVNVDRDDDGKGDHWVAISSRITNLKSKRTSYGYFDPAGKYISDGTISTFSKGSNGKLQGVAKAYKTPTNYKVVGVRKNNK